MHPDIVRRVWERANGHCEYCQLPCELHPAPFQIDHIIAKQHGGTDTFDNLALACLRCNRYKGPNVAGIDPDSGALTRLFHPRTDDWNDHFSWDKGSVLPLSPVGRVTVNVLFMNEPELVLLSSTLAAERSPRRV